MNRGLAFIGWSVPAPTLPGRAMKVLPAEGAFAYLDETRGKCPVLALGDGALARLNPRGFARRAGVLGCPVFLVPTPAALEKLPAWLREGGVELAPLPTGLARLLEVADQPVRVAIDASFLAKGSRVLDPQGSRILELLPGLPELGVGALAGAMGIREGALRRVCRAAFGRTPSDLLDDFQEAYEEQRHRDGATWRRISVELGYAEEANLHRARRGRRRRRGRVGKGPRTNTAWRKATPDR